ncbi:hypothetical protein JCM33374_g5887 [Metschnikowia sp. JCM 33374]|nr:hypothetical protein JCM33374_g5887 [Metschnikowia sp. JCM 33374]
MAEDNTGVKNDTIEQVTEPVATSVPEATTSSGKAEVAEEETDAIAKEETEKDESTEAPKGEVDPEVVQALGQVKHRVDRLEEKKQESSRKRRRRQYDDAPKEEPESEDGEDDNDDKDGKLGEENDEDEDDDDDNLGGVDASNIIAGGRRTRGKKIDYKKANEEVPLPDDDDEDDEEFEDKGEDDE